MKDPYFTPGTWKYSESLNAIIVVRKHRLIPVADFGKIGRIEQDANAKVMAASKEMYAALKECLTLIDDMMPGVKRIALPSYQRLNDAPIAGRAAILKAEKGII